MHRQPKEKFVMFLPGPMLAQLRAEQEATGTDKSELIRRAIDFYFLCRQRKRRGRDEMAVMPQDRCPDELEQPA